MIKKYIRIAYPNKFAPLDSIVEGFKITKEFIAEKRNNNIFEESFGKLDIRYDKEDSILCLNVAGIGQHQRFYVNTNFGGRWIIKNIETNDTFCPFDTEMKREYKEYKD